jgi:hypothetical protein
MVRSSPFSSLWKIDKLSTNRIMESSLMKEQQVKCYTSLASVLQNCDLISDVRIIVTMKNNGKPYRLSILYLWLFLVQYVALCTTLIWFAVI